MQQWVYGYYVYWKDDIFPYRMSRDGGFYVIRHSSLGQYTGVNDKDGKEIYEGDILKDPRTGQNWLCEYKDAGFWLSLPNEKYSINLGLTDGFIIVGNIHQYPELLN